MTFIIIVVLAIIIIIIQCAMRNSYKSESTKKSDEVLINEYVDLTNKIAAEAFIGSQRRGIGSNSARDACNDRIRSYRDKAEILADILESRGYKVDRSRMNGVATKPSSGKASVVKHAAVGGVIAGPVGAIVGAASAIDKNNRSSM